MWDSRPWFVSVSVCELEWVRVFGSIRANVVCMYDMRLCARMRSVEDALIPCWSPTSGGSNALRCTCVCVHAYA